MSYCQILGLDMENKPVVDKKIREGLSNSEAKL